MTMRREIEDNLIQAEADLKTAKDNITMKNYYAAVFFCQQAAEKSLKALYILKKSELPEKTHNLSKIALELDPPPDILSAANALTPAAVLTRYSDVLGMPPVRYYTIDLAQISVRQAEVILTWVKKQLK